MNDTESINRLEEPVNVNARLVLGQTGCTATLDDVGIIHIFNADGQQLYAVKVEHIPFAAQPLLVTLNLWFMAFSNGRTSMQQEVKAKVIDIVKLLL